MRRRHSDARAFSIWTFLDKKVEKSSMPKNAITLHGLASCDTTRAARKWLDAKMIDYRFHDVREDVLSRSTVEGWVKQLGWEKVLNKASTTWRELSEKEKAGIDRKKAIVLLLAHPTLVKRPVLDCDGELTLGFKSDRYARIFAQ